MPKLTQRLTPGCIITVLAMLLVLMATGTMDITWDTMERGAPRLSQLPRLMLKLPQRLTPGCTTAMLVTDSTHTVMVIMVWAMLPMPDITRTLTMEAAEMATEPWFPVLPGNSVEVSALVLK